MNKQPAFFEYLQELRKVHNLTLRMVSSRSGVSNPYISQLESGLITEPSPSKIRAIAKVFSEEDERKGFVATPSIYIRMMLLLGYITPDELIPINKVEDLVNNLADERKFKAIHECLVRQEQITHLLKQILIGEMSCSNESTKGK